MSKSNIIGAYDAIAPLYEEYSSKRQAYLDAVDELVIEQLGADARLLDIGSGDGRRLAKIKQRVGLSEIVAVEPSAEMARICEKNVGGSVHQEYGENLDQLDIGKFDVATALWNIFGHIPDSSARLKTLINIRQKLKPDGRLILDVNNRHNALAYGKWTVFLRRLIDGFNFKESRGDAHYDWQIGDKTFAASGHLFAPAEIEQLFAQSGYEIFNRYSVNYASGEVSSSRFRGQLFYILKNAD
ncbi:MAG: methyltransferase domain-containing protein [Gammaproteobacteria bacterium]|nr:methyltransferase domain-containing protein [Gammaproteobacteria bacterium]